MAWKVCFLFFTFSPVLLNAFKVVSSSLAPFLGNPIVWILVKGSPHDVPSVLSPHCVLNNVPLGLWSIARPSASHPGEPLWIQLRCSDLQSYQMLLPFSISVKSGSTYQTSLSCILQLITFLPIYTHSERESEWKKERKSKILQKLSSSRAEAGESAAFSLLSHRHS